MKIVKIKPFPNSYWSDQSQFRDQQSLTGKKLEHRVQAGDQVKVTGQLREEVWKDPFDNSEYIIASLAASNIQRLAAAA